MLYVYTASRAAFTTDTKEIFIKAEAEYPAEADAPAPAIMKVGLRKKSVFASQ